MSTSFSVVCYKSKTLKNGENPLMLQVSKNGKRQYKSLGVSIHPKFWDTKKNRLKQNCPNKEIIQKIINDKLAEIQNRVLELNAEKKEYTTTTLLNNDSNKFELKTVVTFYKELIAEFTADNKCGNRLIYKSSYNSLMKFTKGKLDIPFCEIDIDWLKKYEKWMRSKNNRETTISLQFHTLRSAWKIRLDRSNQLLGYYTISEGGITETMADVRMILQGALLTNATGIILAHNHPSGSVRPGKEDDRVTKRIAEAAEIMNIRVNDHIILTSEGFYSYNDEGRI